MRNFRHKKIERTKTLGERLKKVREEAGLTLAEAAQGTQIREKYLAALEQGNYGELPGPVYIENFLKKYSQYLGVNSDFVLTLYHQHDKRTLKSRYRQNIALLPKKLEQGIINPKFIRRVIVGLVIAVALIYVVSQVAQIFSPPVLLLESPADYLTVSSDKITVRGSTEPESVVTINGREVFLDSEGNFTEVVGLKKEMNEIVISASKEKSSSTVIKRHVLYQPEQ